MQYQKFCDILDVEELKDDLRDSDLAYELNQDLQARIFFMGSENSNESGWEMSCWGSDFLECDSKTVKKVTDKKTG